MDELETAVELTLAVFPEAAAFFEPGKGTFDHPTFRHDGKGMEVTAFSDLHGGSEGVGDSLRKRFTAISSISQHTANSLEVSAATGDGFQGSFAVGYLGGRQGNCMGQPLGIDGDVAFDARYFLASIVALFFSAIGVLHALRVHDQERRGDVAPLSHAGLANLIF